jgi:hypothetical protein
MDFMGRVGSGVLRDRGVGHYVVRLLGRLRITQTMDGRGNDPDGAQHRDVPDAAGRRGDDSLPNRNGGRKSLVGSRFEPPEVLGLIAMLGLFAYAFRFEMDATIAGMLSGLFGVLIGRSTKGNGKK